MNYIKKYLKYKQKYLTLKNKLYGGNFSTYGQELLQKAIDDDNKSFDLILYTLNNYDIIKNEENVKVYYNKIYEMYNNWMEDVKKGTVKKNEKVIYKYKSTLNLLESIHILKNIIKDENIPYTFFKNRLKTYSSYILFSNYILTWLFLHSLFVVM